MIGTMRSVALKRGADPAYGTEAMAVLPPKDEEVRRLVSFKRKFLAEIDKRADAAGYSRQEAITRFLQAGMEQHDREVAAAEPGAGTHIDRGGHMSPAPYKSRK